jgi:hypothetical protein
MSQYRDDRAAASLRIEALEASVAERDAELARRRAALAERDEEIFHLQRELELAGGAGPRRMRSVNAAWASRIVGAASGLAIMAAGAGVTMVRSPSVTPAAVFVQAQAVPLDADPFVTGPVEWVVPFNDGATSGPKPRAPSESSEGLAPIVAGAGDAQGRVPIDFKVWGARDSREEVHLPRHQLEARVWGGHASVLEILALRRICASEEDHGCRDRADAELQRELQRLRAGSR